MREEELVASRPGRLSTLLLGGVLLVGCSGIVSHGSSGQFGPSWQAREVRQTISRETIYFQEDDDLGEKARRAEAEGREERREWWWSIWVIVGGAALLWLIDEAEAEDEHELTFDASFAESASAPSRLRFDHAGVVPNR